MPVAIPTFGPPVRINPVVRLANAAVDSVVRALAVTQAVSDQPGGATGSSRPT